MANTRFEYVKEFEIQEKCLLNCWIVVRVDGKGFSKFAATHKFKKPNDIRALTLMTTVAKQIMREFPDVILSYGQSDEYSFVLHKNTTLYNRRVQKIVSIFCSYFTAYYITFWSKFFAVELEYPPTFDARVVTYPTDSNLRDYLAWRQADVHINNLYNTCFWNLVLKKKVSHQEAENKLKGTVSSEKNELLFSQFGINYNNEPEEFKKGTVVFRTGKKIVCVHVDIIGNAFWEDHGNILGSPKDEIKKVKSSAVSACMRKRIKVAKRSNENGKKMTEYPSRITDELYDCTAYFTGSGLLDICSEKQCSEVHFVS